VALLFAAVFAVANEELFATIALSLPVQIFLLLTIRNEAVLRWCSGGVFAAAAALTVYGSLEKGHLSKRDTILLLAAVGIPFRLLPIDLLRILPELGAVAGALLLIALLPKRRVALEQLLLAFAALMIAPEIPLGASLYMIVLATLLWLLTAPSPFTFVAATVATLVAGKWSLPLFVVTCAASWIRLRRNEQISDRGALLPVRAGFASLTRALAVFPDLAVRLRTPATWLLAISATAAVLLLRPHLALLYFVACIFMIVTLEERADGDRSLPVSLIAISVTCLALASWSGVTNATLGLALPERVLLMVLILGALSIPAALPNLRLLAGGAALIAALGCFLPLSGNEITEAFGIGRGETRSFLLPRPVRGVSLIGSGAHITDLVPGTPLADIDIVDDAHAVYRRAIVVGDFSDWGFLRAEQLFGARNAIPDNPRGLASGAGVDAWLGGEGEIRLRAPRPIIGFSVTVNRELSSRVRLNFRPAGELR